MSNPILLAGIFSVATLFLAAALLQWLWNMTVPEVFGLRAVRYWQAFRLLLIAGILFGSSGLLRMNVRSPSLASLSCLQESMPTNALQATREDARA